MSSFSEKLSNEMLNDVMSKPQLLNPDLSAFSLYENSSFIIVSAETEYISTRTWYRNINFLKVLR
jgi:hypothetical protein